jgi:hypothetical protein
MKAEQTSYAIKLQEKLQPTIEMLQLLSRKKDLLNEQLACLNRPFKEEIDEKQEIANLLAEVNIKIELIEMEGRIHTLEKIVKEKQEYFKKWAIDFDMKIATVKKDHEKVLATARAAALKGNKEIEKFLANVDQSIIDSGIEYKVNFHFQLLKLLGIK